MSPLWTSAEIAAATGGVAEGAFEVTGVALDSREVANGDLFVALTGEHADGHDYIGQALSQGAAGLLVGQPRPVTPHVRVADTQAALEALGRAARTRLSPRAKIVAVTGSAGKTGVKEALRETFARLGPTHASVKSYNNHTGVPLSLARMPAATMFGVFEVGMNHAGEIARLSPQIRPHVALVTTIAPAHIEYFANGEEGIADAKAEIFSGLKPGGVGVIPYDSPHYGRLRAAAERHARTIGFGLNEGAQVRGRELAEAPDGSSFVVELGGALHRVRVPLPGRYRVLNSLALIAATYAAGVDVGAAIETLATVEGLPGRGLRRTIRVEGGEAGLIDESYNANPAAMAAALGVLGDARATGRKLVVLGSMKELGPRGPEYHEALVPSIRVAGVAHAVLVGEETRPIADRFAASTHVDDWRAALDAVRGMLRPGDLLLVKGSNALGLANLVAALTGEAPC